MTCNIFNCYTGVHVGQGTLLIVEYECLYADER